MKLEEEIRQSKFASEKHKANLNLLFTSSWLESKISSALKPYGISPQQYNILRILQGQKGKPATIKLLTERMLDKMSNTSRLVEKLKSKNLVQRIECEKDRRQVDILLTERGVQVLSECTKAVEAVHLGMKLKENDARMLNELLDKLRA
jgi:DNA-binding MarR family transcriptional regulator